MRKILFLFTVLTCGFLFSQKNISKENQYYFYENKGQIVDQDGKENADVKYLFHSAGLNVQLRSNGFSYDVYQLEKIKENNSKKTHNLSDQRQEKIKYKYHRIDIDLVNSNLNAEIIAEDQSPDYENFYNVPSKPYGVTNVHRFKKVIYKGIYNNIDLVFFKPKDTLKPIEYNFIVRPGGKVSDIKMKFNGAKTSLKDNKIMMKVRFGEIQENIPLSWLLEGTSKKETAINFKQIDENVYGFIGKQDVYNKTLVIDPVPTPLWIKNLSNWVWHSEYGYYRVLANSNQEVYTSFTTIARYNIATSTYTVMDFDSQNYGYISKFDPSGNKIWGTYIGNHHNSGDETNVLKDIVINSNNDIYAVGYARDTQAGTNTITTPGAHKEHSSYVNQFYPSDNTDAFIVKLNDNGLKIWGTYFGGEHFDAINSLVLDSNENLVLAGITAGNNGIATSNAAISTNLYLYNGTAFIAKFTPNGQQVYGSYFNLRYGIKRIAKDDAGNIYVAGDVHRDYNNSGPGTLGTHQQTVIGESNAYVAKLNGNLQLLWGTYFGGKNGYGLQSNSNEGRTYSRDLKIDKDNNIILLGNTDAHERISTPGTHQTTRTSNLGNDIFLTKFNSNGNQIWGTYYGATTTNAVDDDQALGLSVDDNNNLVFAGQTSNNAQIATSNGFLPNNGGGYHSGFFTKFSPLGNQVWGSYFYRGIHSIFAKSNNIYTLGGTNTTNNFAKFYDCAAGISATSNSPVCTNSTVQLSATGGTTYNWTGPNGFTSNLQNPTIPNATAAHSGTYTCQVSGSGACDGSFTVNVVVGDILAPVPDIAILPTITGDCHTVITSFPTATDHCAGAITATTSDPLSYSLPGTYTIHWNYNDGNGNIFTQNQTVTVNPVQTPIANTAQTFCATNIPKISDLQVTGQNIKWYDAAGNILPTTTLLINGQTYHVSQTINGCESGKIAVQVTIKSTPKPTANTMQDFCVSASPTLANVTITGTSVIFYNASGNVIPTTTPLVNGQIYYATQTLNGCESEKLAISVTLSTNNVPATNQTIVFCNSTTANTMSVNLHSYESNIISNPGNYIFTYTDNAGNAITNLTNYILNTGTTVIIVKVATIDGCFTTVRLTLTLNPKPFIELPEKIDFCQGKTITLDAGQGFTSYLWSTGATTRAITVSSPGTYSVTVKNIFGCENTRTIQVTYSVLATIVAVNINSNTATVILSETGNYEYSLDNFTWQDSNIFTHLSTGEYTVYVRTKSGCIIGQKKFSIFNIQNAVTPNGDGNNDTWKIAGLENYPGTEIYVYDRKGFVILKEIITNKPFVWDGKYHQQPLATGNYWYTIKVSDGRTYSGWLLVKNRD
ncbi:hypothetical protein EG346_17840 [Chryseobacterium carnipullorum]|uniref:DUF7948 domain-containing protein n=1 Tax=Chryseobacterium carnipullorum TaxID=1124835 RepID=A0A3G6NIK9_CHRCU|nr:T9SS type B sorting domain-containing protein [Chryseobacterium carnipullorum]AZA49918.1 hypothetical protein EG346_17840 [Chryseobacterium carnipullorum]AZA64803.1 hypothetical protein EG345_08865 [Chryseobacterium carnipullorum]